MELYVAALLGLLVMAATIFLITEAYTTRIYYVGAIESMKYAQAALVTYAFRTNPVVVLVQNRGSEPINVTRVDATITIRTDAGITQTLQRSLAGGFLSPGYMFVRIIDVNGSVIDVTITALTDKGMFTFTGYPPPDIGVFIATPDKIGRTYEVSLGDSVAKFTLYEYLACAVVGDGKTIQEPLGVAAAVAYSQTSWQQGWFTVPLENSSVSVVNMTITPGSNGVVNCSISYVANRATNVTLIMLRGLALASPGLGGNDIISFTFAEDQAPTLDIVPPAPYVWSKTKLMVPVIDTANDAWFFLPSAALNAPAYESRTLGYYFSGVLWLGYVVKTSMVLDGSGTISFSVDFHRPYPAVLVFSAPYVARAS